MPDPGLASMTVGLTVAGSSVQGRVFALEGATLLPRSTVNPAVGNQLVATAPTDTNGVVRFRVLLPGRYTPSARSPATALSSNQTLTVFAAGNVINTALTLGNVDLKGRVTDSAGPVQSNATVAVFRVDGPPAPAFLTATTSSEGQFATAGLFAGSHVVEIRNDGYATRLESVSLEADTTQAAALSPGATVAGRVATGQDGLGIGGAVVSVLDPAPRFLVTAAVPDSNRVYTAYDLSTSAYDVVIAHNLY